MSGKTPSTVCRRQDLGEWWKNRGYSSNPFAWYSAESIDEECLSEVGVGSFSELFQLWRVDPNVRLHEEENAWMRLKRALGHFLAQAFPRLFTIPTYPDPDEYDKRKREVLQGLGDTPTLNRAMSPRTSEPVLTYAPEGGGKTFYRRWAARQVEEHESLQYAVEIPNFAACVEGVENVTAHKLAFGIYEYVCDWFSINGDTPLTENVYRILDHCDRVLKHHLRDSQMPTRVHLFVDGVDQLFDDQPSAANRNDQALAAIVDLCKAAAKREGWLALRMFIPAQLERPIEERLGKHKRIKQCGISWSVEHSEAIVERRLNSFWKRGRDTGVMHVARLFTVDALYEFGKWLQRQKSISPRCVIETLNRLADYARSRVTPEDQINVDIWSEFLRSKEPPDPCGPDTVYPLPQSSKFPKWLWPALLLILSLSAVLYASASARRVLETVLFDLVRVARETIVWLASVSDWIQAFLLLSILLGSILFVLWCLMESAWLKRRPDLLGCLRRVWQLICQHLLGGS